VDLIFSTATFHWIKDHDRLFRRLAQALKPQGWLVAQCGGKDNIARTRNAMEQVMGEGRFPEFFTGLEDPWNFAAAKTTKGLAWRLLASVRSTPGCTRSPRSSIRWTSWPAS
jgi:trans-aconitate 2-methyltransferase